MNLDKYLYPLMAASLAIGIFMGLDMAVPYGAALFILCGAILSLVAFSMIRRGVLALAALCFFFILLGFLRSFLPPFSLLPDALFQESIRLSHELDTRLHASGFSMETASLLSAMLLGNRDTLNHDTILLYRQTGASHILALSGMHLSILFGFLNYCFLRLINTRFRYIIGWLSILLIWSYVILTGMPVSLCRASLMMTLLLLAEMNYSGSNVWDMLGIAALCLLFLSPSMILDVGFQLSFAAVTGIFLFYTPVRNLFQPTHKFLRWLWQAWSVSFAAQVFTLPLLLHYFRFICLSGVLLSPIYILLATCIIFSALFYLLLRPFDYSVCICYVVETLVSIQHALMLHVSHLSWGGVQVNRMSAPSVILVYTGLLCLLPSLRSLKPVEAMPKYYRLAMFFRTWPYLLASLVLFMVAYIIG